MTLAAVAELARRRVVAVHLLGDRNRNELGHRSARRGVEKSDLELVADHRNGQTLAWRYLAEAFGQPGPALTVNALAVVPPLRLTRNNPPARHHVIDQSLRDRHIGLTRHRRIRPVDPREILTPRVRHPASPSRTPARGRYEPAATQRGGGHPMRIAFHDPGGTAVGDPTQD
jgi:hypothetical protein